MDNLESYAFGLSYFRDVRLLLKLVTVGTTLNYMDVGICYRFKASFPWVARSAFHSASPGKFRSYGLQEDIGDHCLSRWKGTPSGGARCFQTKVPAAAQCDPAQRSLQFFFFHCQFGVVMQNIC